MSDGRCSVRLVGVAAAAAMVVAVGCGGGDADTAVSSTSPGAPATSTAVAAVTVAPASSATSGAGPATDVFEGVVVAIGQTMIEPHPWWWVIDLVDGATIEGMSRVLVEVANDDVGCGDEFHRMFAYRIEEGEPVSFGLSAGEPGPRPEFWMTLTDETFDGAPTVRGQRLRAACPRTTAGSRTRTYPRSPVVDIGDASRHRQRRWPPAAASRAAWSAVLRGARPVATSSATTTTRAPPPRSRSSSIACNGCPTARDASRPRPKCSIGGERRAVGTRCSGSRRSRY